MSKLQYSRTLLAIVLAAALHGCSGESEPTLETDGGQLVSGVDRSEIIEVPASSAAEGVPEFAIDVAQLTAENGGDQDVSEADVRQAPKQEANGEATDRVNSSGEEIELEILGVADSQLISANASDVLVYLPFDDNETFATAGDQSGNGNNGEITGAVYVAESADGSSFSLDFDGVDDGVSLGNLDVSGTGLTLSAFIKADTFPGDFRDPRIISKSSGTASDDHVFMLGTIKRDSETTLRGRLRVNGVTHTLIADAGASMNTGRWYHTALVYDGSRMTLYLNGEDVGGLSLAGNIDQNSAVDVAVGKNPDGSRIWDGLIDEVLIMERALSIPEVAEILESSAIVGLSPELEVAHSQPLLPIEEVSEPSVEEVIAPITPMQTTELAPILGAANSENNLSFPGALGWAAETTTGGRGGRVVIVDSLSNAVDPNDGVTTFREAMTEIDEPRIIVFSVAGLIDYRSGPWIPESQLVLNNTDSDVTIACQSAPPPGITLMGDGIRFARDTNNVVMRHCRFRNSDPKSVGSADNSSCIRAVGSTPNANGEVQRNYLIDHVSCMWAADDPLVFMVTLAAAETGASIKNVTISNSIVAEGDADSLHSESGQLPNRYIHAMGPGCASASATIGIIRCSIVRNFIAHNARRNPQFWFVDEGEVIDNIIYNFHEVGLSLKARFGELDAIIKGNIIQLGPTTKSVPWPIDLRGSTKSTTRIDLEGNYLGQYKSNATELYNEIPEARYEPSTTNQVTPSLDTQKISSEGSDHLRCVGASRPRRDSHDQRVINEFHQQSGQVGVMQDHERDFSEYIGGPIEHSWADSDGDGMPDNWESKMAIDDPNRYDLSETYTNIEVFLNGIALCPSVTFDAESVSLPAGTREIDIPFNTTWETWLDGQSFEVCLDNKCRIFNDPTNSGSVKISVPADGKYQLTLTPVGSDGVREPIYGSTQVVVGQ